MDLLDALDVAVAEFRRRLAAVGADQWSAPTPCDEWDVRFLVAHVVGGHRFAALVLAGANASDAFAEVLGGRVLGDDPLGDHDAAADAQRGAFRHPGALTSTVDHPLGPCRGADFLATRVFDVTVHAWDLARAAGLPEDLDAELAATVLAGLTAMPDGPGFGIVPVGATDDLDAPLARLLDLSGRRP